MMSVVEVLLANVFGVLMVGAASYGADGAALGVAAAALLAVLVGAWLRSAATGAALLTVLTLVLADPAPLYAALAGLAATAYLVLRHGAGGVSAPTMFFAVGCTALITVAVVLPIHVRWLPLAAPLVLLTAYLLVLRPFLASGQVTGVSTSRTNST